MSRTPPDFCSLDELLVRPAAATLRQATATQVAEADAFLALSRSLAEKRGSTLQAFVDLAMAGTDAGSAGISLEERDEAGPFFRWVATAGEFSRYVNGTMPRDFSPCGATVDGGRPLIMRDPVRYYAYISQLHTPVRTVLLVPFRREGRSVGTVWVAAHDERKSFTDAEVRFVENLGRFASDVLDSAAH
ncbi:GAF domain-containing protein [Ramlibacter pallidus]|uniref:GAF domain-containing protein n=1 Tax=Ramlibacter pallidus TaxID=2780087 RepID=A0ABR9S2Q0_9BURK|nr:GAF domain-containing protein [Ramlibacter pallidus]MBE7367724.1 GAF domain-containing protein [Ramlibacter pallidus]